MHNQQKTILIVEDEVSLREALSDKLKREGFAVLEAKDGEAGVVLALQAQPNLILLDVVMPKMDGMMMLKKLRPENAWSKNVPIILLTNLGTDDEKMITIITEDPSTYYLVKSNWSLNDIVKKVKDILLSPFPTPLTPLV